jgi:RHS repeat-associated protein
VDGTLYYVHSDLLGSTVALSDAAGGAVGRVQYDPYGEVLTSTLPVTLTDRLFTGARFDGTIGLYQMGTRWYDPALGRWMQPDTIVPEPGNPQDFNRYTYVRNNPVTYRDPSGHCIPGVNCPGDLYGDRIAGPIRRTPTPGATPTLPPGGLPMPWATGMPIPTPTPQATWGEDLLEREPDYRGVSVEVGVPTLVIVVGAGLSEVGLPEVGLPIVLIGTILDLNPVTGPVAIGGAFEWDVYGHHYGSVQASWGHAWPLWPVAVNVYGVRIFTEGNRPAIEQEVTEFVPGWSIGAGGSFGYGGGLVWNPNFGTDFPGTAGLQTGWAIPLQAGISIGYAFQID